MMIRDEDFRLQLKTCLDETRFDIPGAAVYHGKVRDNYTFAGPDGTLQRAIVCTDRISAFDVVLGTIPFKGQVLNQMAAFWFNATRATVPNHMLGVPDPNVMAAVACTPLPVEFVMRAFLTGVTSTSIWKHYEQGARTFCGHALPDGMKKNQRLPAPILTPSTKAEHGGHDRSVSREELIAEGVITADIFDDAALFAAELFAFGQKHALERGLILADTKYEMGIAPDGTLVVIDEIHTPDSSRYWYADDYEARFAAGQEPRSLDKEYVRRWLSDQGYTGDGPPPPLTDEVRVEASKRYIASYELITGLPFFHMTGDARPRIAFALGILP